MGSGASSSGKESSDITIIDVPKFRLLQFQGSEVPVIPDFLEPTIRIQDLYLPIMWNLEKEVTRGRSGTRSTIIHYNQMRLSRHPNHHRFERACGFQSFTGQKKYRPYPFQNYYPFYLVPGQLIQSMTRLPSHEELLQEELLLQVYSIAIVEEGFDYESENECTKYELYQLTPSRPGGKMIYLHPESRIIFFSHRWEAHLDGSVTADNEDKTKLRKLKTIVKETDFVWLDYMCIPQSGNGEQQLKAIQSLPYYIARSHMLYVLTTDEENRRQYKSRAFPNLELLCASLPVLSRSSDHVLGSSPLTTTVMAPLAPIFDESGEITGPFLSPHNCNVSHPRDLSMIVLLLHRITFYLQDLHHHTTETTKNLLDLILPGLPAFTDEDDVEDQYRQLRECTIERFITSYLPLYNQNTHTELSQNTSSNTTPSVDFVVDGGAVADLLGAKERSQLSDKSAVVFSPKPVIKKTLHNNNNDNNTNKKK